MCLPVDPPLACDLSDTHIPPDQPNSQIHLCVDVRFGDPRSSPPPRGSVSGKCKSDGRWADSHSLSGRWVGGWAGEFPI